MVRLSPPATFFFFNDTATTEIYTLSLHDALPISTLAMLSEQLADAVATAGAALVAVHARPRLPSTGVHWKDGVVRSEEHTSELQSQSNLVCRLLLEKKKVGDARQR